MSDIDTVETMLKRASLDYRVVDEGSLFIPCQYDMGSGQGDAIVEFDEDGGFVTADWQPKDENAKSLTPLSVLLPNSIWVRWNVIPDASKNTEFTQMLTMMEDSDYQNGEIDVLESNDGSLWGILFVPFDGDGFVIFGFRKSDEMLDHVVGDFQ